MPPHPAGRRTPPSTPSSSGPSFASTPPSWSPQEMRLMTSKTDDPQARPIPSSQAGNQTSDISPASSHQIRSQWSHQLGVSLSLPPPHQGRRLHLHGLPPESGESIPLGPVSSDHRLAQSSAASEQWIQLAWKN